MLKNYLTIAIRILFRYRGYSLINISGLAIGMACAALILLYVQDELNFDTHHIKRDRIYRVIRELKSGDNSIFSYRTSGALAPAILQDIPAAEQAIRTFWFKTFVRYEDTLFDLQYCIADPEILNVFTIPFLKGDRETALQGAGTAVLTASAATKIFGRIDPIGKQLRIDGDRDGTIYTITGIVSDPPTNSSLHFELLTAHVSRTIPNFFIYWTNWRPMSQYRAIETYVLLREKADPVAFQMQLAETMKRYMGDTVAENNAYHLQAMNRMHLYSAQDFGLRDHLSQDAGRPAYGDINQIYLLSIIALIVLVIACVNFTNLTTSRAISRATEVGVRKVVGAHRGLLIFQFFFEIMLLTLVGSIIALCLLELILPGFNAFVDKDLTLNPQRNPIPYVIGPVVVLIIGIVAGGIPAFYLSAFQPIQVLSGKSTTGLNQKSRFRQGLVVFQFGLAVILIAFTFIVHKQLKYMQMKDLGFLKEQVIELDIFWKARDVQGRDLVARYQEVKQIFLQHPNVLSATATRFPQDRPAPLNVYQAEGLSEEWRFGEFDIDESYVDFFGVDVVQGRNLFIGDRYQDRDLPVKYLLNETAVEMIGWDQPIGKRFGRAGRIDGVIVGVIGDFHLGSLHHQIPPLVFRQGSIKFLYLKIVPQNMPETLQFIGQMWKELLPERPFTYAFLDEKLNRTNYAKEIQLSQVFSAFSALAILISCLGLLGLVSFMVERRTKEIGIRKVLGASEYNILRLFLKEFLFLVIISNVIALPIAYWGIHQWLESFAYRTQAEITIFAGTGLLTLFITGITVGFLIMKNARKNPVDALRYE